MKTNQSMHCCALRIALPLIIIVATLSSCGSDEVVSTTLSLTVTNSDGMPQNDLSTVLYATEDDWLNAQNQIHSGSTNEQGKVSFSDLARQEYFIDINENNTTNWGSEIKAILVENKINELAVMVSGSREHLLVEKKEKSWMITGASLDGFNLFSELDDCEKDNIFFYQREDHLGILHLGDLKCEVMAPDQETLTWKFTNDESELQITGEDGTVQIFKVVSMTSDKMVVDIEIEVEGQLVDVRFTFETIRQ